jgi:hypothetical protein
VLVTHCPVFRPSCIHVEENALVVILTSISSEFVKHGEGSFPCFHVITFQRRVVTGCVLSLYIHFSKEICSSGVSYHVHTILSCFSTILRIQILRYPHENWYTYRHKYFIS